MRDRLPLYPGRVKLVPVSGQENVYDMTRADQPTQAGDPLNKATLLKDATAALFGLGTDAVPDDVLAMLSKAALYKTVTQTAQLGTLPEGSIIYLNENGSPVPFYVAKQGYEPSYNTNRALVVRKDVVQTGAWNASGVNTYNGSTIDTWMNGTYIHTLDSNVQAAIGTTNIPYTPMGGNKSVRRISKAIFALSLTELGLTYSNVNTEGSRLEISNILIGSVVQRQESAWTRSPYKGNSVGVISVSSAGAVEIEYSENVVAQYWPAFTLPTTFTASLAENTGLYDVSNNLLLKLPGVQIATGSYVGTGKYGSSNKNNAYIGFIPKFFLVYSTHSYPELGVFKCEAMTEVDKGGMFMDVTSSNSISGNSAMFITDSGGGIRWWSSSNAERQFNRSEETYYYFALG